MRTLLLLGTLFLLATTCAILLLYGIAAVRTARPVSRTHMDGLPPVLKLIWPLVNVLQFHISGVVPTSILIKRKRQLQLAGMEFLLVAEEFISLQLISSAIFGLASWSMARMLNLSLETMIWAVVVAAFLGLKYPILWMSERRKKREKEILRTLPGYLDMITLCCQAGLGLTGAIVQSVEKGAPGALRSEFDRMLRDMRAGMSRTDALRAMAERMDNAHITSLVSNIIQAESLGASMADMLASFAEQRRTERFQFAEKLAMEAPVKMIGPLVMFIFPVTFIIIFFPLAMQFMQDSR